MEPKTLKPLALPCAAFLIATTAHETSLSRASAPLGPPEASVPYRMSGSGKKLTYENARPYGLQLALGETRVDRRKSGHQPTNKKTRRSIGKIHLPLRVGTNVNSSPTTAVVKCVAEGVGWPHLGHSRSPHGELCGWLPATAFSNQRRTDASWLTL